MVVPSFSCLLSLSGGAAAPPQVDIDTVEKFESLRATEQQYFTDMVKKCKDSGACPASHQGSAMRASA